MNKKELQKKLDAFGVEYPESATNDKLEKLLKKAEKKAEKDAKKEQATEKSAEPTVPDPIEPKEEPKVKYKEVKEKVEYFTYGGKFGRKNVREVKDEMIGDKMYKVVYLLNGTREPCSEEELAARLEKHTKIVTKKVKIEPKKSKGKGKTKKTK